MFLRVMTESSAAKSPNFRLHLHAGSPGIVLLFYFFFREILLNIPTLIRTRREYRRTLRENPHSEPWIAFVGDIVDEVNGMALACRAQLREMRKQGHQVFLFGVAFHSRKPRTEDPDQAVVLAPGPYSMDQLGYPQSELAIISLKAFCEFLRKHPVDIIEFQNPGPVSSLCLMAAKFIGIRTLPHYRTDMITYIDILVKNPFTKWFVQTWNKQLTLWTGLPVIVPSDAFREKVAAMGVAREQIHKLPRGVDHSAFHPRFRDRKVWKELGIDDEGFLLLYIGRVSPEKNMPALADAFLAALKIRPDLRLIVIGDGPLRTELNARLHSCGRAHFPGVLRGETLSRAFASADLFVFPSLTDTFGNSVIEALACGLPCLVSDEGGPREIVEAGSCGEIFHHKDPLSLRDEILSLAGDPEKLERYRMAARARAGEFTFENSARAFWNLYTSIWKPK